MNEDFDKVGWLRGQIMIVEFLFISAVICAIFGFGAGMFMFGLALLPSSVATGAHLVQYYYDEL